MNWRLEYSDKARKQLRKLDAPQRASILMWMDKNIDDAELVVLALNIKHRSKAYN
jgi:mRNA-degrading endonuclease RelE of RelBE toxin-antitoxin system